MTPACWLALAVFGAFCAITFAVVIANVGSSKRTRFEEERRL